MPFMIGPLIFFNFRRPPTVPLLIDISVTERLSLSLSQRRPFDSRPVDNSIDRLINCFEKSYCDYCA